jgi:hypothetical protein
MHKDLFLDDMIFCFEQVSVSKNLNSLYSGKRWALKIEALRLYESLETNHLTTQSL